MVAAGRGSPDLQGILATVSSVWTAMTMTPGIYAEWLPNFSVMENMPALSPVGMVTVIDGDKGRAARVQLTVGAGQW